MYWNEKVELIKRRFSDLDFKDPFRSGGKIIEKIIVKLFGSTWQNFTSAANRSTLLKQGKLLKTCTMNELYKDELPLLGSDQNFWLLLINLPMGSGFHVYDCKYEPLRELLYLSSGQNEQEFCVVDKKYSWLLLFRLNRVKNLVEIYTTGNINIPMIRQIRA
ncbi:hypothetical protein IC235_20390 [Hymenobacter sp. BT664]|uniref:Uncharacterized protein n=1 Tax=Hymenobacter montanus TaxID=2771359 RepID=A0A927BHT1_9BACT|nr:hypothetical protein [Hymenobacter montanus]MBD2770252.1 hypothetical protein [Hymenobacter montanus]